MSRLDELRQVIADAIEAGNCGDGACRSTCGDCATKAVLGRLHNVQRDTRELDVTALGDQEQHIHWQRFLTMEVHLEAGQYTKPRLRSWEVIP